MRKTTISLLATVALICLVSAGPSHAQSALTGTVSSTEEGPMEGVLVTAKRDGSTIAITVVTDAKGHYGFPAARLDPGHYTLRIRAVGYDLDGKPSADIAAGKRRHRRPQAQEDAQHLGPAHQCGVARERARHAGAEGCAVQLRELSYGRADRQIDP